jgi:phytol kinase
MGNPWIRDVIAAVITLAVALIWLRVVDSLAARGVLEQRLSRKVIHIGTGPIFVACWLLFTPNPAARYLAALVPLLITGQFAMVGTGLMQDPAAVAAMTRHGDRREILRGPLFYGIVFVVCTIVFWRTSPVGILALMLMCGGDGLADVIGRRYPLAPLPFNEGKSWGGSLAMLLGGFVFALAFVALFQWMGLFDTGLPSSALSARLGIIALLCTLVEALPLPDIDNLTVTAVAVGLGLILL